MPKHFHISVKTLVITATAALIGACGLAGLPDPFTQRTIVTPKAPSSVIVCRSQQCAPARTNMTREFLYNSLLNLFDNNVETTVLICDADPNSRMCFENYIQFNIKAGVTPATVVIDSAKILSVKLQKDAQIINVALDYNMHFNAVRPACMSSANALFVKSPDYVLMEDTGYVCKFTTTSDSMVSNVFAIDYVDLDYGVIGANYSFGVAGPAYGGGAGYMLMRFQKNAFPSDPKNSFCPKVRRKRRRRRQRLRDSPSRNTASKQTRQSWLPVSIRSRRCR